LNGRRIKKNEVRMTRGIDNFLSWVRHETIGRVSRGIKNKEEKGREKRKRDKERYRATPNPSAKERANSQ